MCHSGPLCHPLSLSSSSSLWTSMRRWRATVQWRHLVNWREAARCGEWAQHFSNASCCESEAHYTYSTTIIGNRHITYDRSVLTTCKPKLTRMVLSCDREFYWGRPVIGVWKMEFFTFFWSYLSLLWQLVRCQNCSNIICICVCIVLVLVFSTRCNKYLSRLCYDVSVRLSVRLSVT